MLSNITHSLGISIQVFPTRYWLVAQTQTVGVQVPLVSKVYSAIQEVHNPVALSQVAQRFETFVHVLLMATCLAAQTTGF